jgi:hypothetical protein
MSAWRSQPVFISSTFADMQIERDHLLTHVFPEVEERLRARRCHLEWVDLRLGVPTASLKDAEHRELLVLKVCLAEVRRCRPFLIVLLGDRYGWVPPADRIQSAVLEEGFNIDVTGLSVTDLEIRFAMMDGTKQKPQCLFYLRKPLPYHAMTPDRAALYSDAHATDPAASDRAMRLAALKADIETRATGKVRHYTVGWDPKLQRITDLDSWGGGVVEDLLLEVDKALLPTEVLTKASWQQEEQVALDDYVNDRLRDFVGRQQILDRLMNVPLASSTGQDGQAICVSGDPGSGKSALLSKVYQLLLDKRAYVLAHATAASPRAASTETMLRLWVEKLASTLGTKSSLPEGAPLTQIVEQFASLLQQVATHQQVTLLADGLDQFESYRSLEWLPRTLPHNVRLIVSATTAYTSTKLPKYPNLDIVALPPMDVGNARKLVTAVCRRYHRALEPEVLDALLTKASVDGPACANPLWTVLATEGVNLIDADDFERLQQVYKGDAAERLRDLVLDLVKALPADVKEIYKESFIRAEQLFGADFTRSFLQLMALGRGGWRERDFEVLLPSRSGESWNELKFARLRRLFRAQLRRRGLQCQLDFSHLQMRAAATQWIRPFGTSKAEVHWIIADHLLALPADDPLHETETMHHLIEGEDWARARAYSQQPALSDAEIKGIRDTLVDLLEGHKARFASLLAAGRPVEALELCGHLMQGADTILDFVAAGRAGGAGEGFLLLLQEAYQDAAEMLAIQGAHDESLRFFALCTALREKICAISPKPAWQHSLSVAYQSMIDHHLKRGDVSEAFSNFDKWATHNAERFKSSGEGMRGQLVLAGRLDISRLAKTIALKFDHAGCHREALIAFERAMALDESLLTSDPDNDDYLREAVYSCGRVSLIAALLEQKNRAIKAGARAVALAEQRAAANPHNLDHQFALLSSLFFLGHAESIREPRSKGMLPKIVLTFRSFRSRSSISTKILRLMHRLKAEGKLDGELPSVVATLKSEIFPE